MDLGNAEAYPDPASPTGSILVFGLVAQERYPTQISGHSATHKHAACFTSRRHRWNKVAEISRSKGVYINAVSHYAYSVMYRYLRQPSAKKPLAMLDAEPFLSPTHPRGDDLESLLASSDTSAKLFSHRAPARVRERAPDVYALVAEKRFRSANELRAHACAEAAEGRVALATWCTKHSDRIQDLIDGAWAVISAPQTVKRDSLTRMQVLSNTVASANCVCGGGWPRAAQQALAANSISPAAFSGALRRALELGAVRGAHVACIGRGGCGKSTLLEPLEEIFKCAEKPQSGSSFPLTNVIGSEVLLWQDYCHNEATVAFSDLLAMLTGESVGVRSPCRANIKFRNTSPMFYSGRSSIRCSLRDPAEARTANEMMDERFVEFRFEVPVAKDSRVQIAKCAKCFAEFVLHGKLGSEESRLTFV